MKTLPLLDELVFSEQRPHAEPLLVDDSGRVLRFTLKPGQHIKKHCAPHASVHIIVLKGKGVIAGDDNREQLLATNGMVVFAAGELHSIQALDEELVFVALLPNVAEHVSQQTEYQVPEADAYLTWHM